MRVRLMVARGDTVGARLTERLALSLADADGEPVGDGVLLPEPEGDAEPAAGVVFLLLLPVLPSPTMSGL